MLTYKRVIRGNTLQYRFAIFFTCSRQVNFYRYSYQNLEIYQNLGANFYVLKIANNVKIVMYYHLKRRKKMSKQNNGALTKSFFMHSRIWLLLGDGLSESIKKGKIMLNVL